MPPQKKTDQNDDATEDTTTDASDDAGTTEDTTTDSGQGRETSKDSAASKDGDDESDDDKDSGQHAAFDRVRLSRDKARTERDQLRDELKQLREKGLTEQERKDQERDTYKSRAERAELEVKQWRVARERAPEHATIKQISAVAKRLVGADDDAMGEDADELYELLAPAPASNGSRVPGKPKERLKGGGEPDDDPGEMDPAKLAARVPRAM
jgi:hypothetical protein